MRRTLRMFACTAVVAGCFAGAQAGAASAQPLGIGITCTPGVCTAGGVLGRLSGFTILTTQGTSVGVICVAGPPQGSTFVFNQCGPAFAELYFVPQQVLGGLGWVGPAGAALSIQPRLVEAAVGLGNVIVGLVASNGDAGAILVKPGSVQCVSLRGTTLVGIPCTPLL